MRGKRNIFFPVIVRGLMPWLIFAVFSPALNAQQQPESRKIDSLTYALYQQERWDELAETGREAIRRGYNYYYMQMRVGIAFYEKTNYRKAVKHFLEALRLNPGDPVAGEYLYYSYLLGGRTTEAKILASACGDSFLESVGIEKSGIIEEIYLETGPGFAINQDLKDKKRRGHSGDTIYNSGFYYNNYYYSHGGIRVRPLLWLSVYQGYTYLSSSFTQKSAYMGQPVPDFKETARQKEYYGNLELALPGGFNITPSYHFIWLNYNLRRDEYDPEIGQLAYDTFNLQLNSYVLAISVKKHIDLFALEMTGSFSHFDHSDVVQLGLFGSLYPLGNSAFYSRTGLLIKSDDFDEDWIYKQLFGVALTKNLWFEAEGTIGNLRDFNERTAFVVYNTPEKINFKIEGNLVFEPCRRLELSLRYRYLQRENVYLTYLNYEQSTTVSTEYPFHTFILGLKWRF